MKKNIFIELTPLLDVILIILFFILVQSEGRMGTFYEETREALEAEFAVLEEELEAFMEAFTDEVSTLREIRADYEALRLGMAEDSGVVMITIEADASDSNQRWVVLEADSVYTRIPLSWSNIERDAARLELNSTLAEKMQGLEHIFIFVVFRFDSTRIFSADYRLVADAIQIQQQFHQMAVAELDVRR